MAKVTKQMNSYLKRSEDNNIFHLKLISGFMSDT